MITRTRLPLGPYPAQPRRRMGRIRDNRFLRPGTRELTEQHRNWPHRPRVMILPGRGWRCCGHA